MVLHRPIETTALLRHVNQFDFRASVKYSKPFQAAKIPSATFAFAKERIFLVCTIAKTQKQLNKTAPREPVAQSARTTIFLNERCMARIPLNVNPAFTVCNELT